MLKKKKERKFFPFRTKHPLCCYSFHWLSGWLYNFFLADQPLDFTLHYKDVVEFSWGDVMEWISLK